MVLRSTPAPTITVALHRRKSWNVVFVKPSRLHAGPKTRLRKFVYLSGPPPGETNTYSFGSASNRVDSMCSLSFLFNASGIPMVRFPAMLFGAFTAYATIYLAEALRDRYKAVRRVCANLYMMRQSIEMRRHTRGTCHPSAIAFAENPLSTFRISTNFREIRTLRLSSILHEPYYRCLVRRCRLVLANP